MVAGLYMWWVLFATWNGFDLSYGRGGFKRVPHAIVAPMTAAVNLMGVGYCATLFDASQWKYSATVEQVGLCAALLFLSAIFIAATIVVFMRPKFLIPPAARNLPGWLDQRREARGDSHQSPES